MNIYSNTPKELICSKEFNNSDLFVVVKCVTVCVCVCYTVLQDMNNMAETGNK